MGANVLWQMDADTQRAVKGILKIAETIDAAKRKTKGLTDESGKAGKGVEGIGKSADTTAGKFKASAAKMTSSLGSVLAKAATVSAAVALIGKGIQAVNAEADRGADTLRSMDAGVKRLAQISVAPGALEKNIGLAVDLSATTGTPIGESLDDVFAALSINLSPDRIRSLLPFGQIGDIGVATRGAGKVSAAFKGKAGSIQQIINKGLVASRPADVGFEDVMNELVGLGPAAMTQGVSMSETAAALSVLSPGGGGPGEVATGISQLMLQMALSKQSYKRDGKDVPINVRGVPLAEGVRRLSGLSLDERVQVLGRRKEGLMTLKRLSNPEMLASLEAATGEVDLGGARTGTADDEVLRSIRARQASPLATQIWKTKISKNAQALTEALGLGDERLAAQEELARIASVSIDADEMPILRAMRMGAAGTAKFFGAKKETVRDVAAGIFEVINPGAHHSINPATQAIRSGQQSDVLSGAMDRLQKSLDRLARIEEKKAAVPASAPNPNAGDGD